MKLTKSQLKRVIQEELQNILQEQKGYIPIPKAGTGALSSEEYAEMSRKIPKQQHVADGPEGGLAETYPAVHATWQAMSALYKYGDAFERQWIGLGGTSETWHAMAPFRDALDALSQARTDIESVIWKNPCTVAAGLKKNGLPNAERYAALCARQGAMTGPPEPEAP
jgi:hypothetical protein